MRIAILAAVAAATPAFADDAAPADGEILVTARRRAEAAQDVPIAINVIEAARLADSQTFNIQRLTQLAPSVQFFSSNPRNAAILIRGLGAPFGLTNDGIEQGVGLYIDGVYYSRPAAASFDLVDIERIEVLRGPQGTLYGKNVTAGSVNITTRAPSFTPEGSAEASVGNYGFLQFRGAVSGPVSDTVALRLGTSLTSREGVLTNVRTGQDVNQLDNLGLRGRLLWKATDELDLELAADWNRQNPRCCGQVFVRAAPTLRAANRQYAALAAASNYAPPSLDPFDRLLDNDSPLEARQTFGGASLTLDWRAGAGTLTAITAVRWWDWVPRNDRDFTGLPITTVSSNFSKQRQYTQELRWAGSSDRLDYVAGVFAYRQTIRNDPVQAQGAAASLWLLGPGNAPALLDGLTQTAVVTLTNDSVAGFSQVGWRVTDRLRLQPGLRLNHDRKDAFYDARVTGGLQTGDPVLIARKNSILGPQRYAARFSDFNVSGDVTASYDLADDVLAYATYARSFKPGGVNLGGLPTDTAGSPLTGAATVRPERVDHFEAGLKTQWWGKRLTLNLAAFDTRVRDYQTTVVNAQIGVLRGYLANAARVRVRGAEFDLAATLSDALSLTASGSFLDGRYGRFPDAPAPLELTGGPQVVDASGQRLPGISRWNGSAGVDFHPVLALLGAPGRLIAGVDVNARSSFSSNPTPSAFLWVRGYALVNARLGWRSDGGFTAFAWVRNLGNRRYFDFLTVAPGGTGLIAGQPGDPRTWGVTLAKRF